MSTESSRTLKKILTCILLVLLVVAFVASPIGYYFYNFRKAHPSDNTIDWANFGQYISPFIGFANVLILGFLTYKLYILEIGRETPILDIQKIDPTIDVYNISSFIAFNIKVRIHYKNETDDVASIDHLVPKDSETFTPSAKYGKATGLTVTYENAQGKTFKSFPSNKLTSARPFLLPNGSIDKLFHPSKSLFDKLLKEIFPIS